MITIDPIRRPSKRNVTIDDINELNEKIKDITIRGIPDKSITTDKIIDEAVTEAKLSQAVKDTVNNKADKSALENYATKEALAGKADASELSNKADKTELADYATIEEINELINTINTKLSTI